MTEPTKEFYSHLCWYIEEALKNQGGCKGCSMGGDDFPGTRSHDPRCFFVETKIYVDSLKAERDRLLEAMKKVEKYAFKASGDEFLMWAQEAIGDVEKKA